MLQMPDFRILRATPFLIAVGTLWPLAYGKVVYVDGDAMGVDGATTWANAHQLLLTMTGRAAGAFNRGSQNVVLIPNALPNNEWVYIAFTRDGNEAALHVNGADRTGVSYSLTPISGTGPLYIGRGGSQPHKGCVEDVRIYD